MANDAQAAPPASQSEPRSLAASHPIRVRTLLIALLPALLVAWQVFDMIPGYADLFGTWGIVPPAPTAFFMRHAWLAWLWPAVIPGLYLTLRRRRGGARGLLLVSFVGSSVLLITAVVAMYLPIFGHAPTM
jgi:hypothetical protein